jgi:hypothetical protein
MGFKANNIKVEEPFQGLSVLASAFHDPYHTTTLSALHSFCSAC